LKQRKELLRRRLRKKKKEKRKKNRIPEHSTGRKRGEVVIALELEDERRPIWIQ